MASNTTQSSRPPPFVVEPKAHHTHTFILLHGLASNGEEFGQQLLDTGICSDGRNLIDIFPGARFIFPTAKRRRSSAFGRAKLTQWFDIASLENPWHRQNTQLDGLAESSKEIIDMINEESLKVARSNIILGGLSHGCAMALSCLLAFDFSIGGFVGMSGWLPFQPDIEELLKSKDEIDDDLFSTDDQIPAEEQDTGIDIVNFSRDLLCFDGLSNPSRNTTSVATSVFLGHGDADEKIKYSFGKTASATLELIGYKVTWKGYEGQGHWYKIPDEIDDIVEFIRHRVRWG